MTLAPPFLHQLAAKKLAEATAPMRLVSFQGEGTTVLLTSHALALLIADSRPNHQSWVAGGWIGSSTGTLLAAALAVGVPVQALFSKLQAPWSNGSLWMGRLTERHQDGSSTTAIRAVIENVLGTHFHTRMRDIEKPLALSGMDAEGEMVECLSGYFGHRKTTSATLGDCCLAMFALPGHDDLNRRALQEIACHTPGGLSRIEMLGIGPDGSTERAAAAILLGKRYQYVGLPSVESFRSPKYGDESCQDFNERMKSWASWASRLAHKESKLFLERFFST